MTPGLESSGGGEVAIGATPGVSALWLHKTSQSGGGGKQLPPVHSFIPGSSGPNSPGGATSPGPAHHLPGPGKMDQIEAKSGFRPFGWKKDVHRGPKSFTRALDSMYMTLLKSGLVYQEIFLKPVKG